MRTRYQRPTFLNVLKGVIGAALLFGALLTTSYLLTPDVEGSPNRWTDRELLQILLYVPPFALVSVLFLWLLWSRRTHRILAHVAIVPLSFLMMLVPALIYLSLKWGFPVSQVTGILRNLPRDLAMALFSGGIDSLYAWGFILAQITCFHLATRWVWRRAESA